ncbi:aminotransferase class V-fold PLP-dependent enzyme [Streptomyces sp. NBC_01445]|uniref:aminotransferase class V-fold PLP-dependent enzyme n=1 Tax=Streptomyces sp. NBC_01445 TaxID=2903869 RepID=UPI002DDB478E|nr:aminotransferase class V-fold PLP-dependent enzyme [Streptomyces sp. NBC_01445]WSE11265.1 aminotransferase class V-fold PLP-dependent enzyme [Streptomyces sp. NBC_01445]
MTSSTDSYQRFVRTAFPEKPPGSYLDTASIGLVPMAVRTAVAECYEALGAGVRGMQHTRAGVEQTRALLAQEFGCRADDLTFASSTGEAINTVARAITWREGDEVLVLADEFPTTQLPWSRLPGVRLVTTKPAAHDDRLGALLGAIGPRTRLVAVAHVNSVTGTLIDLSELGQACARVGALLLCDGAQSAGVLPVDTTDVDFFVTTGYKWLLAGFGIAFTITKPTVRDQLSPTLLGHANMPPSQELAVGTPNLGGIHALGAAARLRHTVGLKAITHRTRTLANRIRDEAAAIGYRIASHDTQGPIVSLCPPAGSTPELVEHLGRLDIVAAARGGHLRISPYFYTADSEVGELLDALAQASRITT